MIYVVRTCSASNLGFGTLPNRSQEIEAGTPQAAAEIYVSQEPLLGEPTLERAVQGASVTISVRGPDGSMSEWRMQPRLRWSVVITQNSTRDSTSEG